MTTSQPFQDSLFADELTSLPGASLVSQPASQGKGKVKTTTVISFRKCFEWWMNQDPRGSLLKMSTGCLVLTLDDYSRTFVHHWKALITPFKRYVFQLQRSELRTNDTDYGLLRTPSSQEPGVKAKRLQTKNGTPAQIGERAYDTETGRLAQVGLTQQVEMLLTPTATERWAKDETEVVITSNGTPRRKYKNGKTSNLGLSSQIERLYPTPTAADVSGGKNKVKLKNGKFVRDAGKIEHSANLQSVIGMHPSLKLQPAFALWMMGYPEDWCNLNDGEKAP